MSIAGGGRKCIGRKRGHKVGRSGMASCKPGKEKDSLFIRSEESKQFDEDLNLSP